MPAKENKISLKRKIILGILIFLLILPLFTRFSRPASAYETPSTTYQFQFEEAIKSEEMNLQSFVNETMKAVAASIQHFISGKFWGTKEEREANPGLLGATTLFIAGIYTHPPASGIQYFADLGRKLGIVKQIHAKEGKLTSGFEVMRITLPVWTAFRNLSYVLFVLILVGMGFAIMFRVKISPQAVITIQAALPKIVIALILITFSYAIVGLLIDVVFFLNGLIANIFGSLAADLFKDFGKTFITKANEFFGTGNPEGIALGLFTASFAMILAAPLIFMFAVQFLLPMGTLFKLIIGILLLIAFIRGLWVLIRSFAMIVINLIFGPFQILIGVLPGTNAMAAWFKNLLANIAVLPVMTTMFFLGGYLMIAGVVSAMETFVDNFGNILSSIAVFDFSGAIAVIKTTAVHGPFWMVSALLFPIIGIFIILLIPKAADIIQSAMTKKPFVYGTAIGEAMAYPGRLAGYGIQGITAATKVGEAWTTRFGLRTGGTVKSPESPKGKQAYPGEPTNA